MEKIKTRASPLDIFFSLGDKITKGDPQRKMNFDYYMMWIIFLAFFGVFLGNIKIFLVTYFTINEFHFQYLGWSLFGMAIMWFQYFNLRNFYRIRKQIQIPNQKEEKIENIKEMLDSFK